MLPVLYPRSLKMFPTLRNDRELHAVLTSDSPLWNHLPPACKQRLPSLIAPTLWAHGAQLTLALVASACLTAMLSACSTRVVAVACWLVCATTSERAQASVSLKTPDGRRSFDVVHWWTQRQRDMSPEEKHKVLQAAAAAIFCNPPATVAARGMHTVSGCMVLTARSHKLITWSHGMFRGYPQLVFQHAGKLVGGVSFPRVMVPCHQLVAWLFLGTKPSNKVVCHYDLAPSEYLGVTWAEHAVRNYNNAMLLPTKGRCLSKNCVCPLCLHYASQSDNANTGKHKKQLPARKARAKLVGVV